MASDEKSADQITPNSPNMDLKLILSSKEGGEKKSKGDEAKELLAKYGETYLATSITLSLISFALCYALINAGVDVPALLHKGLLEDLEDYCQNTELIPAFQ